MTLQKIQLAADTLAASLRPMAGDDSLCWGAVKVLALYKGLDIRLTR
jgi:membrane protein involved in colicin uptake